MREIPLIVEMAKQVWFNSVGVWLWISCMFLAVFTVGCGASAAEGNPVDMSKLQEDMLAADAQLPAMRTVTDQSEDAEAELSVLTDFDYGKVNRFFYSCSASGTPEEIAVLQVKEVSDIADLMTALSRHMEQRQAAFQQYSPEQMEMIEKAVLTYEGSYVTMIISEKCGAVQEVFKKAVA